MLKIWVFFCSTVRWGTHGQNIVLCEFIKEDEIKFQKKNFQISETPTETFN